MPLWMTLLAPVGIGLMIAVCWWLGGLQTAQIADPGQAQTELLADYPEFVVQDVVVTDDRALALCAGDNALGVVRAVGDKFVTSLLRKGDVAAVSCRSLGETDHIEVVTKDFSRPKFALALHANAAVEWRRRLDSLVAPN